MRFFILFLFLRCMLGMGRRLDLGPSRYARRPLPPLVYLCHVVSGGGNTEKRRKRRTRRPSCRSLHIGRDSPTMYQLKTISHVIYCDRSLPCTFFHREIEFIVEFRATSMCVIPAHFFFSFFLVECGRKGEGGAQIYKKEELQCISKKNCTPNDLDVWNMIRLMSTHLKRHRKP